MFPYYAGVKMFVITSIIAACITALIGNAARHAFQKAQEPSEVDFKISPEEKLRQIYRSAYIADLSLRGEAASKSDH